MPEPRCYRCRASKDLGPLYAIKGASICQQCAVSLALLVLQGEAQFNREYARYAEVALATFVG